MKTKTKILILSAIIALSSCVSTKAPNKIKKASRKLEKHITAIDNIVKKHPELMDSLTATVHDTIILDSHTVDTTFIPTIDTNAIDSMIFEVLADMPIFEADARISNTERVRIVERVRTLRNQIIKEVLKDTTVTFNDSLLVATFAVQDGTYVFNYKIKKREVPYIKQETTLQPKIVKQPAWKNSWFWILILIIIVLLSIIRHNRN